MDFSLLNQCYLSELRLALNGYKYRKHRRMYSKELLQKNLNSS